MRDYGLTEEPGSWAAPGSENFAYLISRIGSFWRRANSGWSGTARRMPLASTQLESCCASLLGIGEPEHEVSQGSIPMRHPSERYRARVMRRAGMVCQPIGLGSCPPHLCGRVQRRRIGYRDGQPRRSRQVHRGSGGGDAELPGRDVVATAASGVFQRNSRTPMWTILDPV